MRKLNSAQKDAESKETREVERAGGPEDAKLLEHLCQGFALISLGRKSEDDFESLLSSLFQYHKAISARLNSAVTSIQQL